MKPTIVRSIGVGILISLLAVPAPQWFAFAQEPKPPSRQEPQQQQPEYTIAVEVPLVNVDVVVADRDGNFITGLQKENFRILVDNQPQKITNFAPTESAITIVILMEFSRILWSYYWESPADNARYWSYQFLNHLGKDDWVALVSFDLRTRIEVDFTQNKMAVGEHIARMVFPSFTEARLFDALIETIDRMQDIKGKKSILLVATGLDTFSEHNLDETLKFLRQSDVTIFAIGASENIVDLYDAYGVLSGPDRVTFLQAKNQLNTFARITGGRAWFPRFDGQLPGIFEQIAAMLRNQYSLAFIPPEKFRDGKFHKIKIEVVTADGKPLEVVNQKGKKVKYEVYAREGFLIPKPEVAD